jgi:intracellular septation protein
MTNTKPKLNPMLKLALDIGPLILFFAANARFGIYAATASFMVAIVVALGVFYTLTRHLPVMPLVTAVLVLIFGGLTLVLHDELFIKVKPTIIYLLFAGALLGGLAFRKPLLGMVFDSVFNLTEEGWRKLTLRWAAFFFVMAVVNEIVRNTQPEPFWVNFKLFGFPPLTFVFAALQYRLLMRYATDEPNPQAEAEREEVS